MSSKDKKDKTDKKDKADKADKKDKTDKKDKADKADKKDKADKADKKDKTDKKDKADKADKKDKKDKGSKEGTKEKDKDKGTKDKDKGTKDKDKGDKGTKDKEKGGSKEKDSGTKEKDSAKPAKSSAKKGNDEDTKVIGLTTYSRVRVKEDKATKTKAGVVWVPEGKTTADKNFVWQEVISPNGEVNYVLLSDPDNVKFELPDIGGAGVEIALEKKKFEERKEWKNKESEKKAVSEASKRICGAEPDFAKLSKDEQGILVTNIAKEYMSVHKAMDLAGQGWMQQAAQTQIREFLEAKKAAQRAQEKALAAISAIQLRPTENLQGELTSEDDLPMPVGPLAVDKCPKPASPLLPAATYLRDPYYYRRLKVKSARRGLYESKLEQSTFLRPGGGEIKVLCAVGVKTGKDFNKTLIFAVARDWCGAFAFFLLEPSDSADPLPIAAYPILEHVDFPQSAFQKVTFFIDGNEFSASFRDQEHATWLHDSLKLAMSSMYGIGNNDAKITTMRCLSVEFASSDVLYFPNGAVPDVNSVLRQILNEDRKEGAELNAEFAQLRVCLRTPEGRDHVLRSWCRSIDEASVFKRKSAAMIANHKRVLEEAIRCPTYHDDMTIAQSVVDHIQLLKADQPDPIVSELNQLRTLWRIVEPVLEEVPSRIDLPTVPFERCFEPEPGTAAERQERSQLVERRAQSAGFITPPGIYLTLVCYCGSQVFCQGGSGALFSEVITPQPTQDDLDSLTSSSRDFQWILQLGGANDNWIQETQKWSEMYRTFGKGTFRSKFLHAANRLLHAQPFSTLGFIFDAPVHQPLIDCAHIVTVLRVDSKDRVPMSAGIWRNLSEMEQQLYSNTLVATEATRIEWLPAGYHDCRRFLTAAIQQRELVERRLTSGFYLGFLVIHADSDGPMILVPEANRYLPPLSLVSETTPTLQQWRWLQSLNERKKRTGTFGLDVPNMSLPVNQLTFEQRLARSFKELETAVGLKIEQFYERELLIADETQTIRCYLAVHVMRPSTVATQNAHAPVTFSKGSVPMVFKHLNVIDDNILRMYWPKIYPPMCDERSNLFCRAYSTAQPFAIDEIVRLQHECAAGFYCDVDKFCMMLSWLRPVVLWAMTDGKSLVDVYGGDAGEVALRSVEDAVDVAMSNYAASQDVNVMTMKSLLFDSAQKQHFSWSTLLSQLRERDRVLAAGYASRLVPAETKTARRLVVRTQDELGPGEEDDDDDPHPPTVYELPCTLVEMIFKDADAQQAEKYFHVQDVVNEVVELACIDAVDVGGIKEIGSVVSDMITIIESTEDLVDGAAMLSLKDETIEEAWQEREKFQRHWLDVFRHEAIQSSSSVGNIPPPAEDEEDEFDDPLTPALFYDGSPRTITSFADGVRVCMAKATNTCEQLQQLLKVTNSVVEALELVQCIQQYSTCVARRDTLVADSTAATLDGKDDAKDAARAGRGGPGVTLVSREHDEYFVPPVDPLRSLVLRNISGKYSSMTISSGAMEVFAQHVRTPDMALPQTLELLAAGPTDLRMAEELLDMAIQLKAPLLLLRLLTALFGTKRGVNVFFDLKAAQKIRALVENSFMFEYGVKDWHHIEVLGGRAVQAAIDVMWWVRFLKEAAASEPLSLKREDAFVDHEGTWKQVYAETRIKVFLSHGVGAINAEEVTLWTETLGRFVEYLTLRESTVGDAEVEVLISCCPWIKSLDLSFTQITSRSIQTLINGAKSLSECSVSGCNVSTHEQDALRRHCTENRRRIG